MRGTKRARGNAAFLTLYRICVWMSFLLVKVTESKKTLLVLFLLSLYAVSSFIKALIPLCIRIKWNR